MASARERALADMADWVLDGDRSRDLADGINGDRMYEEATSFDDSPSFYANSIFSETAVDKMDEIKSRFVAILRRNKVLEQKFFHVVRGVAVLSNAIASIGHVTKENNYS